MRQHRPECKHNSAPAQIHRRKTHQTVAAAPQHQTEALQKEVLTRPVAINAGQIVIVVVVGEAVTNVLKADDSGADNIITPTAREFAIPGLDPFTDPAISPWPFPAPGRGQRQDHLAGIQERERQAECRGHRSNHLPG